MTDAVTYEQDGAVVTLTLNEPETRNALSPEIIDAIVSHVARINADLSVGCVILTGAGEGFSSGGNVKKMKDILPGIVNNRDMLKHQTGHIEHDYIGDEMLKLNVKIVFNLIVK